MANPAAKRERTCIACGTKAGKGQLHRLVRCADGSVRFDAQGNLAGRGAYVCSRACFKEALAGGKIQRTLRTSLDAQDMKRAELELEAACAVEG